MLRNTALVSVLAFASTGIAQDYFLEPGDPQVLALCYENDVDSAVSCACTENLPLVLNICLGQIEPNADQLFIYDGLDEFAPVLYASSGTSDLSGIIVVSTGNALTCRLISDGANSCVSEGYLPIVFSVNCAEAVACDIGIPELTRHDLHLFPEPSDGLLSWRSTVELSGAARSWVCDLTGRSVRSGTALAQSGNSGTLDLRSLPPGQYVLHTVMTYARFSRRFSIVR